MSKHKPTPCPDRAPVVSATLRAGGVAWNVHVGAHGLRVEADRPVEAEAIPGRVFLAPRA